MTMENDGYEWDEFSRFLSRNSVNNKLHLDAGFSFLWYSIYSELENFGLKRIELNMVQKVKEFNIGLFAVI